MAKINRIRCPYCGGRGVVGKVEKKGIGARPKSAAAPESRLPALTGPKSDTAQAIRIRDIFVQRAKHMYDSENFVAFIRMISYEAHYSFWIINKDVAIDRLIMTIVTRNPGSCDIIAGC